MGMKSKEIAKKLGVSPATISLVLNNKPGISNNLRHSLIQKIQELGCGDMLGMQKDSSKKEADANKPCSAIAYLIYTASDEKSDRFAFFPAVLEGAEMESRDNNFRLMVFHMQHKSSHNLNSLFKNDNVVGAIVQSNFLSESVLNDLSQLDIPYVFIDSYRPNNVHSSVSINNEQGMYTAVSYLRDMGHTQIGYVYSGHETDSHIERRRSFHQALRNYKLEDKSEYYFSCLGETKDAQENLYKKFKENEKLPTAFINETDLVAWSTMNTLNRCGYKIPDDFSIIGFDDRSICTLIKPNLTSIKNSRHLLGRESVMLLQNKIRMKKLGVGDISIKFELPTELIIRDSVRKLN